MAQPAQLTIRRDFPRPTADEIAPFLTAPTGWVVDAQGRRGALPPWIRPLSRQNRFVGTAPRDITSRPVGSGRDRIRRRRDSDEACAARSLARR